MHIPMELVERVLLNLPVKSLSRFSSVSKSWNSMIQSRDFDKRYHGREMIGIKTSSDPDVALVSPLTSVLSCNPMPGYPLPWPISCVRASCGELWCLEFENGTVVLYNPSTGTCRNLPAPWSPWSPFIYGVGYDSATDDYKVLKFNRYFFGNSELYSRRSDSWRMLGSSKDDIRGCMSLPSYIVLEFLSENKGVFVNGSLYWILSILSDGSNERWGNTIVSFDLSTEKFGKVALPESAGVTVGVSVWRGKLCVYSNIRHRCKGEIWVHDGGIWSKELVLSYSHVLPNPGDSHMRPLCCYHNSNFKAFVITTNGIPKIFLYEEETTELVGIDFGCRISDSFTYLESLLKP